MLAQGECTREENSAVGQAIECGERGGVRRARHGGGDGGEGRGGAAEVPGERGGPDAGAAGRPH